ncbi:hypothetical protein DPMN_009467 [Dreissena polymorpha]|uniref:Uncharacterized protein n=1 Tax=Dreissena polymorpha TaxID=45954 RepID=A0A9D4N052_DREPO|nr:hypothetical protein DPMN_009467 [Dreissena polymorpha]
MARQRPTRLIIGPCVVEIDRFVIRDVQYQLEVNRCRNEEVNFQGSSAYSVGGDSGQDGRRDGQTDGRDNHNIPTLFKKQVVAITKSETLMSLAQQHQKKNKK